MNHAAQTATPPPRPVDPGVFLSLAPESSRLFSLMNPVFTPGQGLTVQFIGANPSEGVSTIARDFALTAAQYVQGSVLLLDFDWGRNSHFQHFQTVLEREGRAGPAMQPFALDIDLSPMLRLPESESGFPFHFDLVPEANLILGRQIPHPENASWTKPCVLNRPDIWAILRRQFTLTVVDAPPAGQSLDGIAISGAMDAVVLVVRAESTRTPVVENLRDRLIAQGAPLVGLVLNRRRFYIPKFVYHILDRL